MREEKLLTVREVSVILGISEKEVIDLAENGEIPAYKVGGVFLRFKKAQVEEFQKKNATRDKIKQSSSNLSLREQVKEFWYFYDFYILSGILIVLMIILIIRGR